MQHSSAKFRFQVLPQWAGVVVIALGALTLLGWVLNIQLFKSIFPGLVSMKANAAVGFVALGSALLLHTGRHPVARARLLLARILAAAVVLLALLTLAEYIAAWNLGVDLLLFPESASEAGASFPGRMSPASAASFFLLGLALLFLDFRSRRLAMWPAQAFTLVVLVITLSAFIGYFYRVESLHRFAPYTTIALHTVIAFWLLCLGILFARPNRGMMVVFTSDSPGGILARRMLPAAILLPLLAGWLRVKVERAGYYDPGIGSAIFATALIATFTVLVAWAAAALNRAESERRRGNEAVLESERREHARRVELETLMEGAPAVVWIAHDPECRRITGNRAAQEMLRVAAGVNVSKTAPEPERPAHFQLCKDGVVVPDEQLPIQRAGREGKPVMGEELELRFSDGQKRWIYGNAVPLLNADGGVRGVVAAFIDITALKLAQQELTSSRENLHGLAARLLEVREEERTKVAREIHDVLAQELTRMKMDIAWLNRRLGQPLAADGQSLLMGKLTDMTVVADTAIASVQRIATELRPVVLDSLGLCAAVEWQAKDFQQRTGIACSASVPDHDLAMERNQATALFRILQESLTNVARHSAATRVTIALRADAGWVDLAVRDNGRGIRPAELNDRRSLGLLGMRERAMLLGGECRIDGAPQSGTTVAARLPLNPQAPERCL